jgi:uncharacterized repeat protein (TIGR03803 family)
MTMICGIRAGCRLLSLALLPALLSARPTGAQTFTELYSFEVPPQNPSGTLVQDSDGNFYGTSSQGGARGYGTVFKVTPSGTLTTLVTFNLFNPSVGAYPSPLAQGNDGNFFGTTAGDARRDWGTVFKITPDGTLTRLVSFYYPNGLYPMAELILGSDGNFYGTTHGNGFDSDYWESYGTIVTVAGTYSPGDGPDTPTPGTQVALNEPNGLWVRGDGTVYILDLANGKIRRLDPNGTMTLLFAVPGGIASGRGLWVSDDELLAYVCSGTVVKRWTPSEGVTDFATGFNQLRNLAFDPAGALVVTDRGGHSVYRLSADGSKTRIAGNGATSSNPGGGDGGLATITGLNQVRAVCFLPTGAYFLGTDAGSQVWYVDVEGKIHLFLHGNSTSQAGDGPWFYNPTEPRVSKVRQITSTREGDLLITEHDSGYVRKVRFLRYVGSR